jgi:tetratricopeptide (TPR) repeat protein
MTRPPPQRWAVRGSSGDPTEQAAIGLVRNMPPPPPLPPEARYRIAARLRAAPLPTPLLPRVWVPLAAVVLLGGGLLVWKLREPQRAPPLAPAATPLPEAAVPAVPVELPAAEAVSAPAAPPAATSPRPAPRAKRALEPTESPLVEEARLLGIAIEQLRKQDRPDEALATLHRYFLRHPRGALVGEAEVTRIDALLVAGREGAALAHLDRLHRSGFAGLPRAGELALQRAELLAARARDAEACRAYDELLSTAPPTALHERALFGRAGCRGRLGNLAGMRADLRDYLSRFPEGRFAAGAREKLHAAP